MLKATGQTHKGAVRKENQDIFRFNVLGESLGYAIVCDGMGGENAGDVASTATIEIIDRYLKKGLKPDMNPNSVRSLMLTAVSTANAVVYEQSKLRSEFSGMGTTVELAVIYGETLHICHVGDSRIYRVIGEETELLTHDHSMVQMMVDRGELTQDEAKIHPKRNYITKAVGVSPRLDPDYAEYPIEGTPALLLCSDGLSNYLELSDVAEQVEECVECESVDPLIQFALCSGGADNITAVLVTMD